MTASSGVVPVEPEQLAVSDRIGAAPYSRIGCAIRSTPCVLLGRMFAEPMRFGVSNMTPVRKVCSSG